MPCSNVRRGIFTIAFNLPDEARTNNICEGWHNAIQSMNGVQNPTIWRFIDSLKKDEDIARVKMISCRSGLPAAPKKRKDAEVDAAIKKVVVTYVKDTEADDEKNAYEQEEEGEDECDVGEAAGGEEQSSREKWLKTREMTLLTAIANITRF